MFGQLNESSDLYNLKSGHYRNFHPLSAKKLAIRLSGPPARYNPPTFGNIHAPQAKLKESFFE